jgi:hypothetical protein
MAWRGRRVVGSPAVHLRNGFVALAFACGCSGSTDTTPPSETVRNGATQSAPTGYQCVVSARAAVAPRYTGATLTEASGWFVGGPSGVRAYAWLGSGAELRWNDGRRSLPANAAISLREGRFAWTGERYLVVTSERFDEAAPFADPLELSATPDWRNHRVYTTDAMHGDLRPVRSSVPANACDVRVTETVSGALVTWFRRGPSGCEEGEPWVLAFDARGDVIGSPHSLSVAGGGVRVQSLAARWDFGRAVVTGRGDRTHTWVLDANGAMIAAEATGDIACPRSGCARVRVEAEVSTTNTDDEGGATALRFDPLGVDRFGAHRGFTVRLRRATVRGFAVSGDLVLVLHSPQGGGCDLSILDLEERVVVAEHHENSTRACEERHVRALPRGFALAGFELPMGAFSVAFDCSRPPR